jgi:hypothetical protein
VARSYRESRNFDCGFHSIGSFTDPNVATQYPGNTVFQAEDVNNKLFVTYTGFAAPFGGVVDEIDTDDNLLTPNHFAANAPGGRSAQRSLGNHAGTLPLWQVQQ